MKTTRHQCREIAHAAALRMLGARPISTSPAWRPGDTMRCACPVCDPAAGENACRASVATKRRSLAWAQHDALNRAKQAQEAPSRAEFAAWMRGVVGERSLK